MHPKFLEGWRLSDDKPTGNPGYINVHTGTRQTRYLFIKIVGLMKQIAC